jgi:hypothetical protein
MMKKRRKASPSRIKSGKLKKRAKLDRAAKRDKKSEDQSDYYYRMSIGFHPRRMRAMHPRAVVSVHGSYFPSYW